MSKKTESSEKLTFRRSFRGYKRKEVEEHIARMEQEYALAAENAQGRIALLTQENEYVNQMLQTLKEENERLAADNEEYRKQLKEQGATVQTLYERIDLLSAEADRLQNSLNDLKRTADSAEPSAAEWKARALTAEETVRRLAEAELRANAERENARHIRLPFGKKSYLDMTLHHKDDIDA